MFLLSSSTRPIIGPVAFLLAMSSVYQSTKFDMSGALVEQYQNIAPAMDSSVVRISMPSPQVNSTASSLQEGVLEPIDICFISSIFGPSVETADRPHDFTNYKMSNTTSFQFFLYTNLEDLETPGWTKVVRNFSYRRFITQSRWGKFMAWKDPEMKACQTIFYFDGHFKPAGTATRFRSVAKAIKESKFGLAQKPHPDFNRSALAEFDAIMIHKKDILKNVNASIDWLQAQPDFYNNCTLYENSAFGKSNRAVLCSHAADLSSSNSIVTVFVLTCRL
jgi:hypothetical protein